MQALEQLQPEPTTQRRNSHAGASASTGSGVQRMERVPQAAACRALGPALQGVIEYLVGSCRAAGWRLGGLWHGPPGRQRAAAWHASPQLCPPTAFRSALQRGMHSPTLGAALPRPGQPGWLGAPRLLTFLSGERSSSTAVPK